NYLQAAQGLLSRYQQNQLDDEHLLLAILEDKKGIGVKILENLKVDTAALTRDVEAKLAQRPRAPVASQQAGQVYVTPRFSQLLDNAWQEAERLKDQYVSVEHIMIALTDAGGDASDVFKHYGVTRDKIYGTLKEIRGKHKVDSQNAEAN